MMSYRIRRYLISTFSLILLVYLSSINYSGAFQCYVCDSKEDIECTENLPDNTRLKAKDCRNITGAKYCVKTTNIYAGEFGTKRFCAANDHGNHCNYIKQPTGEREYRSCVLTCDSELCNGSPSILSINPSFFINLLITGASSITIAKLAYDTYLLS